MKKVAVFLTCSIMLIASVDLCGQSNSPAIFVTNNVGDSVSSFLVNNDGSLALVGSYNAGDAPQSLSLSPDGRFLAVTHATVSSTTELVIIFGVNADASLTQLYDFQTPDSPLNCAWLNNEILAITKTDLGDTNYIITYRWDAQQASVTQVDMQSTGTFNTFLDRDLPNQRVFANDSFGDRIYSFDFDSDGNLSLNEAQSTSPVFPVALKTSPDGLFIYGAGGISGTGNEIIAYSVNNAGLLSPIAGVQSPGQSPKVIGLTDDGLVLVAGHGTDSTIQSFLRDPEAGTLKPSGFQYDVGSQGNLGDLQVVGDLMFVTDESTSDDGLRGVLSFRINSDGSFTQLGAIIDAGQSRPEYIETWRGPAATILQPESMHVFRGNVVNGDFSDTLSSDDSYLICTPGFTLNSDEPPVWITFESNAVETPSGISLFAESQAGTPGVSLFFFAYNFSTQAYDELGGVDESFDVDTVETVMIGGDPADYVESGSSQIRARIGWRQTGFTLNYPWQVRLDQFGWNVN